MAWIGWVLQGVGVASSLAGDEASATSSKRSLYRKAEALEINADNAIGQGQREMLKERKNKELIASRALALSAASGSDMSSPDIVNILADIEAEGVYRESVALYEGEERARAMRSQAEALREGIDYVDQAADINKTSTLVRGASQVYSTYSARNPGGGNQGFNYDTSSPAWGQGSYSDYEQILARRNGSYN